MYGDWGLVGEEKLNMGERIASRLAEMHRLHVPCYTRHWSGTRSGVADGRRLNLLYMI